MNNPLDTLLPTSRRIADRYEVIRPLGVGALGVSYLCRDHDLKEVVCLKLAYRHMLISRRDRRKFDGWLRTLRAGQSPRLAALHRSGSDPEVGTFFVSSFIEGKPLAKVTAEAHHPFLPSQVRELLAGVQRGLNDLGDLGPHGVLHLNNILLTDDDPVLTDAAGYLSVPSRLFVDAHRRQGTHIWLAPEVMRERQDLDERTDIFSICAIAAYLLTGQPPGLQQRKDLEGLHPALQAALRAGLTDTAEERVGSLHALEAALDVASEAEPDEDEFTERTERSELSVRQEDLIGIYEVEPDEVLSSVQAPVPVRTPEPSLDQAEMPISEAESITDPVAPFGGKGRDQQGVLRSVPQRPLVGMTPQRTLTAVQYGLLAVIGLGAVVASYLIFHGVLTPDVDDRLNTHRTVARSPEHSGPKLDLSEPVDPGEIIKVVVKGKPDAGLKEVVRGVVTQIRDGGNQQFQSRKDVGLKASLGSVASEVAKQVDLEDGRATEIQESPAPLEPEAKPAPKPEIVPAKTEEVLAPPQNKVGGRPICGRGMALIPGGPFAAGSNVASGVRSPGETRTKQVAVGDFCMDRYEYPNYLRSPPRGNFSALQAKAMCEAKGKRICREFEWEKACKGPRGQAYGYGPGYIPERCNTLDENQGAAVAPLKYPKCRSGYRTFSMTGNLSEWVEAASGFALKGGSYEEGKSTARCAARSPAPANRRRVEYGVRCCADPSYE